MFKKALAKVPPFLRIVMTYVLVLVGWVIFYFTDTAELLRYLGSLIGLGGVPLFTSELWMVVNQYSWFPLLAFAAAFPLKNALRQDVLDRLQPVGTLWLTLVFVLSILLIVGQSYNPFIYFRF